MRNMAFVLWMMGWPLVAGIKNYLFFIRGHSITTTDPLAGILEVAVWIFIGWLVYEKKPARPTDEERP